jgi:hypothetical protein
MRSEPFWLADFQVMRTARGRRELLRADFSLRALNWIRRLATPAPAWANLCFQRDVALRPETLDRRAWLLAWVFATLSQQYGQALTVAREGERRWGGELFAELAAASSHQLRRDLWRNFPGFLWRRVFH